jgi:chitodextrinase
MKKIISLLAVCFCIVSSSTSQVIFQDNFEGYATGAYNNDLAYNSSTGLGWWQIQNAATSALIFPSSGCPVITTDQHKIVNTGAYQGSKCARVYYNTSELWSGSAASTGCRWRAEFAQRLGDNGFPTSGAAEVWYGFMIKPMKTNGNQWTKRCMGTTGNDVSCVGLRDNLYAHVSQFVADEDGAKAVIVDIRHDGQDQANARYFEITNIGRTGDVLWDTWNSIIIHVKTGTGGLVEAWVNGTQYSSGSINLWTASWTHDFKIGIYGDRVNDYAETFFDNLKIAQGTNQYNAVNPLIVNDTQAPTTPGNLTANNINSNSVGLSWTASTDNIAVTGYDVYKGGVFLKNVSSTSTTVGGLSTATAYSFYVKAKDAAGNASAASNTVNVTTSATPTNLLTNGDVEAGLTNWSGNNASVAVSTSVVHYGTKSLSVTGRNQNWSAGQHDITSILNANGQGNYAFSAWARMANGSMSGVLQVKITAGGTTTQYSLQTASINTAWSKLSGTANLTWSGNVTEAYLFIDGNNKNSYYMDDAVMVTGTTLPANLLTNGNVEAGLTNWSGNNASVAVTSTGVHGGTKALNVTGRNQNWSAGQYDITSILNSYGQGSYAAAMWMKMASGTMNAVMQIKVTANGTTTQYALSTTSVGTSWKEMTGTANITWSGTLTSAYLFVDGNNTTSYVLDDAILKVGSTAARIATSGPAVLETVFPDKIKVFPNPAVGRLQIQMPENWTSKKVNISLVNSLGQTVLARVVTNSSPNEQFQLPAKITPGLYYLKLNDGNRSVNLKVQIAGN